MDESCFVLGGEFGFGFGGGGVGGEAGQAKEITGGRAWRERVEVGVG